MYFDCSWKSLLSLCDYSSSRCRCGALQPHCNILVDRRTMGSMSSPLELFQCNPMKGKPMTFCSAFLSVFQGELKQVRKKFRVDCCDPLSPLLKMPKKHARNKDPAPTYLLETAKQRKYMHKIPDTQVIFASYHLPSTSCVCSICYGLVVVQCTSVQVLGTRYLTLFFLISTLLSVVSEEGRHDAVISPRPRRTSPPGSLRQKGNLGRRARLLFSSAFSSSEKQRLDTLIATDSRVDRGSCQNIARIRPVMLRDRASNSNAMDSSFSAKNLRRIPELPLRLGQSVLSWDGSESALEFHKGPEMPPWAASSGVLLPPPLAVIKPCPDIDGYYPMVRHMTSTSTSASISISKPTCSSVRA